MNAAVAAPAATSTEAGVVNRALFVEMLTVVPGDGELFDNVTVHVLEAPELRVDGEHETVLRVGAAVRVMAAL